jgi:polygalacturonase
MSTASKRIPFYFALPLAALFAFSPAARTQDTRTVTEPMIPPSCVVLHAEKLGQAEQLPEQFEKATDTARIQKALDGCGAGKAVELAMGEGKMASSNAFLSGAIDLREGVTLLVDKGVTLYGSRDPKDYDSNPAGDGPLLCGTMSEVSTSFDVSANTMPKGRPCKSLITINVKDAAIMGDGVIDGRGFAKIMGKDYSWWQMARAAEPKQQRYFSIRLITASHADGLILYRVTLHNSPNYHVSVNSTDGFTVWGVHLQTPTNKSWDARNTDGIDPGSSTNVTVTKSWIDNGDDNIAIKTGTTHMSVIDNHFYSGHGMSIGSETNTGVSYLLVDGLVENHTTSGVRIKSNAARGGLVHDLVYKNICMKDVGVPIAISPYYNNQTIEGFTDPGIQGKLIPDYKKITLENIYDESAGDVLIAGKDEAHRTEVTLKNVTISGNTPAQIHLAYDDITLVGGGLSAALSEAAKSISTVKLTGSAGAAPKSDPCAGKFVPMW